MQKHNDEREAEQWSEYQGAHWLSRGEEFTCAVARIHRESNKCE